MMIFCVLNIVLILAKSADPNEMQDFIWVYIGCQSTHLRVSVFYFSFYLIPAEDAAKIFKYHFSFTGSFELHPIVVHIFFQQKNR